MAERPSDVCVHVIAAGRVQGVSFRWTTREKADQEGVDGWVRNLPDGTVEAKLQGPRGAVESVVAWMRSGGPPGGRVDRLDVTESEADEHCMGFQIRT